MVQMCLLSSNWQCEEKHISCYPVSTNISLQGAYNSGKPGKLRDFCKFWKTLGNLKYTLEIFEKWKSDGMFRWRNLKPTTSRHVSVWLQWYLWTAVSGLLDFSGRNTFRWWNCGRTPTLTFITQRRLTLQLELGRLHLSYWCLCCWEEIAFENGRISGGLLHSLTL